MTMKSTICQGSAFSEVLHLTIVIIVPVFGKLKSPCFRIIISGHNDIVVTIVTTRDWDQGLELGPDIPHGVESAEWRVLACHNCQNVTREEISEEESGDICDTVTHNLHTPS